MKKGFLKRISVFLTMVLACLFMSINTAQALDRQKDDSDLTQINIYQFTLTRDNMTVLSQGTGVKRERFLLLIQADCPQQLLLFSQLKTVPTSSITSLFR